MYYEQKAAATLSIDPGFWKNCRDACAMTLVRLVSGFRQYQRNRRDYKMLLEAPDYLLEDIGLTREQVGSLYRPRFFR